MALTLNSMSFAMASHVYRHPRQQAMPGEAAELISRLRCCHTPHDYYLFQQDLLRRVLEVQAHRASCQRVLKRLRSGGSVPGDAPHITPAADLDQRELWEVEVAVGERVDRQLRSIADAMAWRRFGYDRSVIVGLSRNQHPGPMYGKAGLDAELRFVNTMWEQERKFVLLHDLTSCLRIGDVSVFTEDGSYYEVALHEVKTAAGRTVSTQRRRQRLAEEALRSGGPLPGDKASRLVPVDIPYRTNLHALAEAFDLAAERAIQSVKAGHDRAALAVEIGRGYQLWDETTFINRTAVVHLHGLKRAGVPSDAHLIIVRSDDLVARVPTAPPWAIYPFKPDLCARLLCDFAMFMVTMDTQAILDALEAIGLTAHWRLPPGHHITDHGELALAVTDGARTLGLPWSTIQQSLLLELADLHTWASAIDAVFTSPHVAEHPWPVFAREHAVWI